MAKELADAISSGLPQIFCVTIGASALQFPWRTSPKAHSRQNRDPTSLISILRKCSLAPSIACALASANCFGLPTRKAQRMLKLRRLPGCAPRAFAFCCIALGGSWPASCNNAPQPLRKDHEFVLLLIRKRTAGDTPPGPLAARLRS